MSALSHKDASAVVLMRRPATCETDCWVVRRGSLVPAKRSLSGDCGYNSGQGQSSLSMFFFLGSSRDIIGLNKTRLTNMTARKLLGINQPKLFTRHTQ